MPLESMELVRLPSPPHILGRLLEICHDPRSSVADLAELINIDAALTAKLVMAINNPAIAIDKPIRNLEQAVGLIGHELVKTMVVTSSIQQLFAGLINSQKIYICNAWLDSLYCAVFSRDIAIALHYENPDDAYLAGLLHDIGQIVFDAKYHEQYLEIIDSASETEAIAGEISRFGISHTELGASIIEYWPGLGPAIADAVRFHHEEREQLQGGDLLCQIVAEASQIARHWSHAGRADPNWHSALIGAADLKKIYIHAQDSVTQTAHKLGISLPRSKSLTQDHLSRDIEKETIRLARKIRDASLTRVINFENGQPPALNFPQELLGKVARELQLFFSISDVVLLFHDLNDPDYLALFETRPGRPASKFLIDAGNSQAMQCFLGKRALWIESEQTDHQKSAVSDRQILRRLRHDTALSLPILFNNQALGVMLIGCDRAQKSSLDKLTEIISDYLDNIAAHWMQGRHHGNSIAAADGGRLREERRDIDKLIHEIGNPLSVIGNYIDILKSSIEPGANSASQEIGVLKDELQRIRNIMMNFKKAEQGETGAVLINAELETCVPLYVKSIGNDREVQIMWDLDQTDTEIDITRDAFRQVILNLVKNAVEAQTEDAAIMVSSRHFANIDGRMYAQFSISDRGRGIDLKTRSLLFAPLNSTKEGGGRGLGLAVVADILRGCNGQIKYMTNDVGGALFEVSIPLARAS